MRLSHALDGFVLTRQADGYSSRTIEIYRWTLTKLIAHLGDPAVTAITTQDINSFFSWLHSDYVPIRGNGDTSPLKPQSIQNAWVSVRSFFNWATAESLIADRPDNEIKRPRFEQPTIHPFNSDDVRALLKAAVYTAPAETLRRQSFTMRRPTADRDVAMMLLLLDTGLRVGECARLQVGDVRLDNGEMLVKAHGSGRKTKSRHVYLGKAGRRALWRYLSRRPDMTPSDPLLATESGRSMDRFSIRLILRRLGDKAGVRPCNPHRFRHTFAIQYIRNGGDVFTLQRLLGHATLEMVRRYVALADSDSASAHRAASPADRWHL